MRSTDQTDGKKRVLFLQFFWAGFPVKRVAILGGGYAGMAAATELTANGHRVTVFEAGKVLGGRARGVKLDGLNLDNGQHLVIGAYTEMLRLMRQVGVDPERAFLRKRLDLTVEPGFRLRCPYLPAPLHLAGGLLTLRGLNLKARWQLVQTLRKVQSQDWRLHRDLRVSRWLELEKQPEQLISRFWQPLTLAALNTPLNKASAQVLLNVLRDSLGGAREASDLLFPKVDFSMLFPKPAALWITGLGGEIRLGVMVKALRKLADGWQVNEGEERFDEVICALPPHRVAMALSGFPELLPLCKQLLEWQYQPISTVYLQYAPSVRLPRPMVGLADSVAQWVFDRGHTHDTPGMIAVVISAEGEHQHLAREALMARVQEELHHHLGLPKRAERRGLIAEKLATFACEPQLLRPLNQTRIPGLWLAGDYTAGDLRD